MPDNATSVDAGENLAPAAAAGQKLRAAREAAGLTVAEVNNRIHLSHDVIAALEAGDFAAIGAPVFVRGHLRNYAELLKLPADDIVAACADADLEAEEFRTHSTLKQFRSGFSIVNAAIIAGLVLLILIGLIYLSLGDNEDPSEIEPTGEEASISLTNADFEQLHTPELGFI